MSKSNENEAIVFKKRKRPPTRKDHGLSVEDSESIKIKDDIQPEEIIDSVRELQNLRKRKCGLTIEELNSGKKTQKIRDLIVHDPFQLKFKDNAVDKNESNKPEDEEDQVRLSKNFASETNKRDEDAEIPEKACILHHIPEDLKPLIGQQKEDMLSNQMLCGIPEIDLGVEAKMRNIESTEEAKQRLLIDRIRKRKEVQSENYAPCNVAVNFVQHSRWNNHMDILDKREGDEHSQMLKVFQSRRQSHSEIENEKKKMQSEKATDSLALQRFKAYARDKKIC